MIDSEATQHNSHHYNRDEREGVKIPWETNFRMQLVSTQYIHRPLLKVMGQPILGCGNISMK
jgi:hypothetical protein